MAKRRKRAEAQGMGASEASPPPPRDAPEPPAALPTESAPAVAAGSSTWARLRRLLPRFIVPLGVVSLGVLGYWLYINYGPDDLEVDTTIAIRDPRSARFDVTVEFRNLSKPLLMLRRHSGNDHMRMVDFQFETFDGKPLPTRWYYGRGLWAGWNDRVRLRYGVLPGALGRHGHQGYLDDRFGLSPGRILFYQPVRDDNLKSFRVRFEMPPGWRAVHGWKSLGDGWFDPRIRGKRLGDSLYGSSLGFGRWDTREATCGKSAIHVHVWQAWPAEYRARLQDRAVRIFCALERLFGFELESPYAAIFTPRAVDGRGIIAHYWSNSLANDHDDSVRVWGLYAHRLLHVLNRDHPYGTHMAKDDRYLPWDNPVNWFNEGVATFFEVWATLDAGIAADDGKYHALYLDYARKHVPGSKFHLPVYLEYRNKDEDVTEYLHYYKAPLVILNLEAWLRARSAGTKTMAGFTSRMYQRYGEHRAAVPFVQELSGYAGFDVTPFLEEYVRDDAVLLPLWEEAKRRWGRGPIETIGAVEGEPVYADAAYRRFREQGPAAEQVHFTRRAGETLLDLELRRRGLTAMPREVDAMRFDAPEPVAALLARRAREVLARAAWNVTGPEVEGRINAWLGERMRVASVVRGSASVASR